MVNVQAENLSIRELDRGYISIILQDRWIYTSPKGQVLNEHKGYWIENNLFFKFDNGSCLDRNHVFVER